MSSHLIKALVFVCLTAGLAAAQQPSATGYTDLVYDEQSGNATAYAGTMVDYDVLYEYQAEIWLTVTKQGSGAYVVNDGMLDPWNGYASVVRTFATEPGATYTAIGAHSVRLSLWDYYPTPPYNQYYFDDWYFSSFVGQGIYEPLGYYFASPGYYEYRRASDIISLGRTYDSESTPPLTVTITKADESALPNPFKLAKTGTLPGGGAAINRKQSLKATVNPANEVANITIEVTSKISISNVQTNSGKGYISFDVVGNSPSSNTSCGGDSFIRAKRSGTVLVEKPTFISVPSKTATPHDTVGIYEASNRVLHAGTSPSIFDLGEGNVALYTIYVRKLTITVKDQCNNLIGDLYAGASITETIGASNVPINQALTSSSTYSDPVGLGIRHSVVPAGSTAATNWPNQPLQPMVSSSASQFIAVQVDGFTLVPGIVDRSWTATPPNTLTITWPN